MIQTQYEIAKQLRNFCNLVVNQGTIKSARSETITSCEQFMRVYDADHERLIEDSRQELQLPSVSTQLLEKPKGNINIHSSIGNQNVADIL